MTPRKPAHKSWRLDHDPEARPLGCNGMYGNSGREKHKARKQPVCQACRDSFNHYRREYTRGQNLPRPVYLCGTPAAAARHRRNRERVCLKCRLAQNANNQRLKAKKRAAIEAARTFLDQTPAAHEAASDFKEQV